MRKEVVLSPRMLGELRTIGVDFEILGVSDQKWLHRIMFYDARRVFSGSDKRADVDVGIIVPIYGANAGFIFAVIHEELDVLSQFSFVRVSEKEINILDLAWREKMGSKGSAKAVLEHYLSRYRQEEGERKKAAEEATKREEEREKIKRLVCKGFDETVVRMVALYGGQLLEFSSVEEFARAAEMGRKYVLYTSAMIIEYGIPHRLGEEVRRKGGELLIDGHLLVKLCSCAGSGPSDGYSQRWLEVKDMR